MPKASTQRFDQHPQFLHGYVEESAANTYTQTEISTPVVITSAGKAIVMEILKLFVQIESPEPLVNSNGQVEVQITKNSESAMLGNSSARTIFFQKLRQQHLTAAAAVSSNWQEMVIFDYQSADGFGYLYGKSTMYLSIKGTSQTSVKDVRLKILYRLLEVSAEELIGIIGE